MNHSIEKTHQLLLEKLDIKNLQMSLNYSNNKLVKYLDLQKEINNTIETLKIHIQDGEMKLRELNMIQLINTIKSHIEDKSYTAKIQLGVATDTLDQEGEVIQTSGILDSRAIT